MHIKDDGGAMVPSSYFTTTKTQPAIFNFSTWSVKTQPTTIKTVQQPPPVYVKPDLELEKELEALQQVTAADARKRMIATRADANQHPGDPVKALAALDAESDYDIACKLEQLARDKLQLEADKKELAAAKDQAGIDLANKKIAAAEAAIAADQKAIEAARADKNFKHDEFVFGWREANKGQAFPGFGVVQAGGPIESAPMPTGGLLFTTPLFPAAKGLLTNSQHTRDKAIKEAKDAKETAQAKAAEVSNAADWARAKERVDKATGTLEKDAAEKYLKLVEAQNELRIARAQAVDGEEDTDPKVMDAQKRFLDVAKEYATAEKLAADKSGDPDRIKMAEQRLGIVNAQDALAKEQAELGALEGTDTSLGRGKWHRARAEVERAKRELARLWAEAKGTGAADVVGEGVLPPEIESATLTGTYVKVGNGDSLASIAMSILSDPRLLANLYAADPTVKGLLERANGLQEKRQVVIDALMRLNPRIKFNAKLQDSNPNTPRRNGETGRDPDLIFNGETLKIGEKLGSSSGATPTDPSGLSGPAGDPTAQVAELRLQADAAWQLLQDAQRVAADAKALADRTKDAKDIAAQKEAELQLELEDARFQKKRLEWDLKQKEIDLAAARLVQTSQRMNSPNGTASAAADKQVWDAQAAYAQTQRDLEAVNPIVDYFDLEIRAQVAEAEAIKLTPVRGTPHYATSAEQWKTINAAQDEAADLRERANDAHDKLETAFLIQVRNDAVTSLGAANERVTKTQADHKTALDSKDPRRIAGADLALLQALEEQGLASLQVEEADKQIAAHNAEVELARLETEKGKKERAQGKTLSDTPEIEAARAKVKALRDGANKMPVEIQVRADDAQGRAVVLLSAPEIEAAIQTNKTRVEAAKDALAKATTDEEKRQATKELGDAYTERRVLSVRKIAVDAVRESRDADLKLFEAEQLGNKPSEDQRKEAQRLREAATAKIDYAIEMAAEAGMARSLEDEATKNKAAVDKAVTDATTKVYELGQLYRTAEARLADANGLTPNDTPAIAAAQTAYDKAKDQYHAALREKELAVAKQVAANKLIAWCEGQRDLSRAVADGRVGEDLLSRASTLPGADPTNPMARLLTGSQSLRGQSTPAGEGFEKSREVKRLKEDYEAAQAKVRELEGVEGVEGVQAPSEGDIEAVEKAFGRQVTADEKLAEATRNRKAAQALLDNATPAEKEAAKLGLVNADLDVAVATARKTAADATLKWANAKDALLEREHEFLSSGGNPSEPWEVLSKARENEARLRAARDKAVNEAAHIEAENAVERKRNELELANAAHASWHADHWFMPEQRSATLEAVKLKEGELELAERALVQVATDDAAAKAGDLSKRKLPMGMWVKPGRLPTAAQRNALYDLVKGPENDYSAMRTMSQPILNEDFITLGGKAVVLQGGQHIENVVGLALLGQDRARGLDGIKSAASLEDALRNRKIFAQSTRSELAMLAKVTATIVDEGGENAQVKVINYTLSTPDVGVKKMTLFEVKTTSGEIIYVDESGRDYDSGDAADADDNLDDFLSANQLPTTDAVIAIPKNGNYTLDAAGNVELYVGDARTERWDQEFRRVTYLDYVIGGAAVLGGLTLVVGSGGTFAPVVVGAATAVVMGSGAYGLATSAESLVDQARHGWDDERVALDVVNILAAALSIPAMGTAGRALVLTSRAFRTTDEIARAGLMARANAWGFGARIISVPTTAVGTVGMGGGMVDLARNWSQLTPEQKSQQGLMFAINFLDILSGKIGGKLKTVLGLAPASPTPVHHGPGPLPQGPGPLPDGPPGPWGKDPDPWGNGPGPWGTRPGPTATNRGTPSARLVFLRTLANMVSPPRLSPDPMQGSGTDAARRGNEEPDSTRGSSRQTAGSDDSRASRRRRRAPTDWRGFTARVDIAGRVHLMNANGDPILPLLDGLTVETGPSNVVREQVPETRLGSIEPVASDTLSKLTPEGLFPELFRYVQLHGREQVDGTPEHVTSVYADSKEFADAVPNSSPEEINAAFRILLAAHDRRPTPDVLRAFVAEHFTLPSQRLAEGGHTTGQPMPPILVRIEEMWPELTLQPKGPPEGSEVPLINGHIKPSTRFAESYGWDTLVTQLGLLAEHKRLIREARHLEGEARRLRRQAEGRMRFLAEDERTRLRAESARLSGEAAQKRALAADREKLVRGMLGNFDQQIDWFGDVINGGRTYYKLRFQQAVFQEMLTSAAEAFSDPGLLHHYLPQMRRTHETWMDTGGRELKPGEAYGRVVCMSGGELLNRYRGLPEGVMPRPREESFAEDVETAAKAVAHMMGRPLEEVLPLLKKLHTELAPDQEIVDFLNQHPLMLAQVLELGFDSPQQFADLVEDVYLQLRAGAETGWDYSLVRFGPAGKPGKTMADLRVTDKVAVDQNSRLYQLEKTIAAALRHGEAVFEVGDAGGVQRMALREEAWRFDELARRRAEAIRKYLWNPRKRMFADYDTALGRASDVATAAMVMPLLVGAATRQQAAGVARKVNGHLRRINGTALLQPGGLASTLKPTGQQWDFMGWAPLHMFAVQAFQKYGYSKLAYEIGNRFADTIDTVYNATGKLWEKYDLLKRRVGGGGEYEVQEGFGWTNGFRAWWEEVKGELASRHNYRDGLRAALIDPRAPLVPMTALATALVANTNRVISAIHPLDPHAVIARTGWDAVSETVRGRLQWRVDNVTGAARPTDQREAWLVRLLGRLQWHVDNIVGAGIVKESRAVSMEKLDRWLERRAGLFGMTDADRYAYRMASVHLRFNPTDLTANAVLRTLPDKLMQRGTASETARNAISGSTLGVNLGNGVFDIVTKKLSPLDFQGGGMTTWLWAAPVNAVYALAETFQALGVKFNGKAATVWNHVVASPRLAITFAALGPWMYSDVTGGRVLGAAMLGSAGVASALEYRRQLRLIAGLDAKRGLMPPLAVLGGMVTAHLLLLDILKLDRSWGNVVAGGPGRMGPNRLGPLLPTGVHNFLANAGVGLADVVHGSVVPLISLLPFSLQPLAAVAAMGMVVPGGVPVPPWLKANRSSDDPSGIGAPTGQTERTIDWEGQRVRVTLKISDSEESLTADRMMVIEPDGTRRPATGTEMAAMMGDRLGEGEFADVFVFGQRASGKKAKAIKIYRSTAENSMFEGLDLTQLHVDVADGATIDYSMRKAPREARALQKLRDVNAKSVVEALGPVVLGNRLALVMDAYVAGTKDMFLDSATQTFIGRHAELANERSASRSASITRSYILADMYPSDPQLLVALDGPVVVADPEEVVSGREARDAFEYVTTAMARTGRRIAAQRPAPNTPKAGKVQFLLGPPPKRVVNVDGRETFVPLGAMGNQVYDTVAAAKWEAIRRLPGSADTGEGAPSFPYVYTVHRGSVRVAPDGTHTVPAEAIISASRVDKFGGFMAEVVRVAGPGVQSLTKTPIAGGNSDQPSGTGTPFGQTSLRIAGAAGASEDLGGSGAERGLYVSRQVDPESAAGIRREVQRVLAETGLLGDLTFVPDDLMHVTVVRSPNDLPEGREFAPQTEELLMHLTAQIARLGKGLVLRLNAPELQARWQAAKDQGAGWTYDGGYVAHVTLSYEWNGPDFEPVAVNLTIRLHGETVAPFDSKWVERKGLAPARESAPPSDPPGTIRRLAPAAGPHHAAPLAKSAHGYIGRHRTRESAPLGLYVDGHRMSGRAPLDIPEVRELIDQFFPTLRRDLERLQNEGWRVEFSDEGSFIETGVDARRVIHIDRSIRDLRRMVAHIVHEVGHVLRNGTSTAVHHSLGNEGAARDYELEVRAEGLSIGGDHVDLWGPNRDGSYGPAEAQRANQQIAIYNARSALKTVEGSGGTPPAEIVRRALTAHIAAVQVVGLRDLHGSELPPRHYALHYGMQNEGGAYPRSPADDESPYGEGASFRALEPLQRDAHGRLPHVAAHTAHSSGARGRGFNPVRAPAPRENTGGFDSITVDPDRVAWERFLALANELRLTTQQAKALRQWTTALRDRVTGFYDARSGLKTTVVEAAQQFVAATGIEAYYLSVKLDGLSDLNAAMNNVAEKANEHLRGIADILDEQLNTQLMSTGGTRVPMRLGGDQFALVALRIDEPTLVGYAETVQREVAQYVARHRLPSEVRLHIGYTSISPIWTLDQIFTAADVGVDRSKRDVARGFGQAARTDRPEPAAAQTAPAATAAASGRRTQAGEGGAAGAQVRPQEPDGPADLTAAHPTHFASGRPDHAALDPDMAMRQRFVAAARLEGLDQYQITRLAHYAIVAKDSVTGTYDGRLSGVKADLVGQMQLHVDSTDDDAYLVSVDIGNLGTMNMKLGRTEADKHFKPLQLLFRAELVATGATVVSMRTGGDELAYGVVGRITEAEVREAIRAGQQSVGRYQREHGMADWPHRKREHERGVRIHAGLAEVLPGRPLNDIFTEADLGVDASKNAPPEAVVVELHQRLEKSAFVMADLKHGSAALMMPELQRAGFEPTMVSAFPLEGGKLTVRNIFDRRGQALWDRYAAAVLQVSMADGSVQKMVFDPLLHTQPVPLHEWAMARQDAVRLVETRADESPRAGGTAAPPVNVDERPVPQYGVGLVKTQPDESPRAGDAAALPADVFERATAAVEAAIKELSATPPKIASAFGRTLANGRLPAAQNVIDEVDSIAAALIVLWNHGVSPSSFSLLYTGQFPSKKRDKNVLEEITNLVKWCTIDGEFDKELFGSIIVIQTHRGMMAEVDFHRLMRICTDKGTLDRDRLGVIAKLQQERGYAQTGGLHALDIFERATEETRATLALLNKVPSLTTVYRSFASGENEMSVLMEFKNLVEWCTIDGKFDNALFKWLMRVCRDEKGRVDRGQIRSIAGMQKCPPRNLGTPASKVGLPRVLTERVQAAGEGPIKTVVEGVSFGVVLDEAKRVIDCFDADKYSPHLYGLDGRIAGYATDAQGNLTIRLKTPLGDVVYSLGQHDLPSGKGALGAVEVVLRGGIPHAFRLWDGTEWNEVSAPSTPAREAISRRGVLQVLTERVQAAGVSPIETVVRGVRYRVAFEGDSVVDFFAENGLPRRLQRFNGRIAGYVDSQGSLTIRLRAPLGYAVYSLGHHLGDRASHVLGDDPSPIAIEVVLSDGIPSAFRLWVGTGWREVSAAEALILGERPEFALKFEGDRSEREAVEGPHGDDVDLRVSVQALLADQYGKDEGERVLRAFARWDELTQDEGLGETEAHYQIEREFGLSQEQLMTFRRELVTLLSEIEPTPHPHEQGTNDAHASTRSAAYGAHPESGATGSPSGHSAQQPEPSLVLRYGEDHPLAKTVNPTGDKTNCVFCALAFDRLQQLGEGGVVDASGLLSALPSPALYLARVQLLFGNPIIHEFGSMKHAFWKLLAMLPEGSRGVVDVRLVIDGVERRHMVNFNWTGGRLVLIDAQAAKYIEELKSDSVRVIVTRRGGKASTKLLELDPRQFTVLHPRPFELPAETTRAQPQDGFQWFGP